MRIVVDARTVQRSNRTAGLGRCVTIVAALEHKVSDFFSDQVGCFSASHSVAVIENSTDGMARRMPAHDSSISRRRLRSILPARCSDLEWEETALPERRPSTATDLDVKRLKVQQVRQIQDGLSGASLIPPIARRAVWLTSRVRPTPRRDSSTHHRGSRTGNARGRS